MRGLRSMAAAGLLLGAGALGAATWSPGHPGASAQETTQTQSQRLAAIHAGSCEDPAEQATFPLAVVQPQQTEAGQEEQASDVRGLRTTGPVSVGNGSVATTLDALLDGEQSYVMLIHRNANETSPGVACGEIGGLVIEGQLTLGLRPINKSGVAGIAVLGGQGEELVGAVVLFDDVDAFSKTNNNRNNAGAGGNQADRAARQGGGGGGQRASGGGGGGGGGGLSAEERAARKAQRKAERQAARAAQGGGGGGPQGGGVAAPPAGGEVVGGVGTQPALEEPQGTVPADETPAVEEPTQPPVDETPAGETPIDETPVVEIPVGETPEPGAETPPAETPPAETPAGETPPAETPPADAEAPPTEAPADEVPIDETGGDVPPADVGDQEQQAAPEETPAVEAFGDVEGSVIGPTTIEQAAPVGAVDHWQAGAPLGQWRPVDTAESALAPEPAAEEVFAER